MEWNSKVKKIGNIFNAIIYVAEAIETVSVSLVSSTEQFVLLVNAVSSLDSTLHDLKASTEQMRSVFETNETIPGLVDQYGSPKLPPYNAIDVLAFVGMHIHTGHEKIDALVDRLGNQFSNEVLAVLKQENAELEVKQREQQFLIEEMKKTIKELTNGDGERDQMESVSES